MVWNSLKNILVEKGEIFLGRNIAAAPQKRTNDPCVDENCRHSGLYLAECTTCQRKGIGPGGCCKELKKPSVFFKRQNVNWCCGSYNKLVGTDQTLCH